MVKISPIILALALAAGCSTQRDARTASAERISASHATTIDKSLSQGLIPTITQSGSSNTLMVVPPNFNAATKVGDDVSTEGDASSSMRTMFRASVSTWVFGCLAFAALILAWVFFSKFSAAGAAADRGFGAVIGQVEMLASHVNTEEAAHAIASVKAALEKQRGKV